MQINERVWRPLQVAAVTGLGVEQVIELADCVEDYLGGWQPVCGRRRALGLSEAVMATLFAYRVRGQLAYGVADHPGGGGADRCGVPPGGA